MKVLDRLWLPISGAVASIGFKGIESATSIEAPILSIPVVEEHSVWYYFVIGVVGAAGGLVFKIIWSALKRKFPKHLKDIDT